MEKDAFMKSVFSGVVMMRFVFFMMLQGAFCAERPAPEPADGDPSAVGVQSVVLPPYSMADRQRYEQAYRFAPPPSYFHREEGTPQTMEKESFAPREDNPYSVQVQFLSQDGTFYWARWNTFGLVYEGVAVRLLLERSLLEGTQGGFFTASDTNLCEMIKTALKRSASCGECDYDAYEGFPLCAKSVAKMFPRNEKKQWQVLPAGYPGDDRCAKGEFRLLFSDGGLSCTPLSKKSQQAALASKEIKRARLREEAEEFFLEKVRADAKAEMSLLEKATAADGGRVIIKYVTDSGETQGVEWKGLRVIDRSGKSLVSLLRFCVMEGTSVGCMDSSVVKHYAFLNESLDGVLNNLAFDLKKNQKVKHLEEKVALLSSGNLCNLPRFSWTVVPQGSWGYPLVRKTISFTFAGGLTLQGVPVASRGSFVQAIGPLFPGNYLWALEYENLLQKKPEGKSWYAPGPHRESKKVFWSNG